MKKPFEQFKEALPDKSGISCRAIHEWFGLTYASYLVLPRVLMEYMPAKWQEDMVRLLNEAQDFWEHDDNYAVQLRTKKGSYTKDPLCHYRHPDYTALKAALKGKSNV